MVHRNAQDLDGRMRIVADQFKVLELEVVDVLHGRIQIHPRQRAGSRVSWSFACSRWLL